VTHDSPPLPSTDLPEETLATARSAEALERFVLGAAFDDPVALHKAIETGLRAEDFSTDERATAWRALVRLDADELPFDGFGFDAALARVAPSWGQQRRHDLAAVLIESVVSGAWVDVHAQGVIRWARYRRAERFARRALAAAPHTPHDVDGWCERFAEGALRACEEPGADAKPVLISESVADLVESRLSPSADAESVRLSLPWERLTDATGGLRAGQLIILAARPKVGKSAAVLAIALHVALTGPVLFASLEMTRAEVSERTVSILGRVNASVASGSRRADAEDREALMRAASLASRLPVHAHQPSSRSAQDQSARGAPPDRGGLPAAHGERERGA
jgi:replicative DNA helicase